MSRVAVVGAGGWGTALADLLAAKGHDVALWAFEPEVAEEINRRHRNDLFLPEAPLHAGVRASTDVKATVRDAEAVVCVAPSHAVRAVMGEAAGSLAAGALVVSASKGLEAERHTRMTEVLREVLPAGTALAALSGPTFAREVYERQPTAAVAASDDVAAARRTQELLAAPHFRVYTHDDVTGVELGGALKNVIAIASGIVDGLGIGHNARAALITRGLFEITRLGVALGAQAITFSGLAGMGDLVLTSTGPLSRNRSLGVELGRGRTLEDVMGRRLSVAEGVGTARAAVALGQRTGVEMPITREVARVLFEQKAPKQAIGDLMERALKAEMGSAR